MTHEMPVKSPKHVMGTTFLLPLVPLVKRMSAKSSGEFGVGAAEHSIAEILSSG
jgi:hypothetical protein